MSADSKKNIFLTGEKNSGKSTMINEFLRSYSGSVGGFKTLRRKTPIDDFYGIYMIDIRRPDTTLSINNRAGSCTLEGKPISNPEVFETAGVSFLSFLVPPSLIVMDELGIMETGCPMFKEKVLECLDSSSEVLGVIKKQSSVFLDSIRNRSDVLIINVENTDKQSVHKTLRECLC